jgi:hypothetical protein
VSSFQDSISHFSITQGSGCCAASTLGYAVSRLRRCAALYNLCIKIRSSRRTPRASGFAALCRTRRRLLCSFHRIISSSLPNLKNRVPYDCYDRISNSRRNCHPIALSFIRNRDTRLLSLAGLRAGRLLQDSGSCRFFAVQECGARKYLPSRELLIVGISMLY